jgi:hypothetical protein
MQIGALGIGAAAGVAPDTPMRLATTAFAFENAEIATYHLIEDLARRAGDQETAAVAERILQEEEAAAELVAGTFDRTLDLVLGEPANSRLPPVTPIGRPSERELDPSASPGAPVVQRRAGRPTASASLLTSTNLPTLSTSGLRSPDTPPTRRSRMTETCRSPRTQSESAPRSLARAPARDFRTGA